jgi:hypothetical protein
VDGKTRLNWGSCAECGALVAAGDVEQTLAESEAEEGALAEGSGRMLMVDSVVVDRAGTLMIGVARRAQRTCEAGALAAAADGAGGVEQVLVASSAEREIGELAHDGSEKRASNMRVMAGETAVRRSRQAAATDGARRASEKCVGVGMLAAVDGMATNGRGHDVIDLAGAGSGRTETAAVGDVSMPNRRERTDSVAAGGCGW